MRPYSYIYLMLPFILSVFFPGLGHVLLSRYIKGLSIFFSVIILLDLSFIIMPFVITPDPDSIGASICSAFNVAAIFIYLYNLWDIFNIVYYRKRKSLRRQKNVLLKDGIKFYLQNDLSNARNELKKALKLDNDDIDILYYLFMTGKHSGKNAGGKRLLNKLNSLDFDKKWVQ